jgi:hypothetical protein
MQRWGIRFLVILFTLSPVWSEPRRELHSYFFADAAYFNEAQDFIGTNRTSEPFTRFIGGLDFSTWPTDHFMIQVNPELISSTQLPLQPGRTENPPRVSYVAYVEEGKGVWTYGPKERPSWRTSLGWQYYKDDPHTRIFGDYLIRSMIYPNLVFTSFHKARTQVFGLRLENNPNSIFGHNFLATSETQRYPYYDISLVYSANAKFGNIFEVGAGVNWVSAIPIRPSRTTPGGGEYFTVADNTYKEVPFQTDKAIKGPDGQVIKTVTIRKISSDTGELVVVDPLGSRDSSRFELLNGKMAGLLGGLKPSQGGYNNPELSKLTPSGSNNLYPELGGTETKYSFSGQTLTFRAALNLLAGESALGKDPFKIYTEAAVLGWKNYPGFYENRRDRIPMMMGINLPTFNIVDFLAVEGEYYPSKLAPTWLSRFRRNVPQPGTGEIESFDTPWIFPERYKKDDWKWGLTTKKSFQGVAIAAQGGSDHMHSSTFDESFHEIMSRPSHWYFMFRMILSTTLI